MLDEKKKILRNTDSMKKIQTNTVVRDFTCLFLLHGDHFGQQAAYDRLGPLTVWKQSPSVGLLCAFSSADTLAVMFHLFLLIMAIAIIIICCYATL